MNFLFTNQTTKTEVFDSVKKFLLEKGFGIIKIDQERPWGGFFVIDESQSSKFKKEFFEDAIENNEDGKGKLSPKILIVEANKRLSWQYHHRRSEIWKVIEGEVGVKRSDNDEEGPVETKKLNDLIPLHQGWCGAGSNRRHKDFQSFALPTELPHLWAAKIELFT